MDTDFRQSVGSKTVVALVDERFDYINCGYLVYSNGVIEKSVTSYRDLLIYLVGQNYMVADIEEAVLAMQQHRHDTAFMGIFGSLIYTVDSLEADTGGIAS